MSGAVVATLAAAAGLAAWTFTSDVRHGCGGVAFAVGDDAEQKLTPSDTTQWDSFGHSVALSGDTALVGREFGSGAVYSFERSGDAWAQRQKLTDAGGPVGDSFGASVALSGDTALVGAIGDDDMGQNSGSASVFVRSGGVWTKQQKLTASDGSEDARFGYSVAVAGDTAFVGAPGDYPGGSVYVFTRSGGVWTQKQKLNGYLGDSDSGFGASVALSNDYALVGSPYEGYASGAAYVFVRLGGSWWMQQQLTGGDDEFFGTSVALYARTALIGTEPYSGSGRAYVYVRSFDSPWLLQQKLTPLDGSSNDGFGYSVALFRNTALVGSPGSDAAGFGSGSAYVFSRSGGAWTQDRELLAPDASTNQFFGTSVALSEQRAIIGSEPARGVDPESSGSAWVWRVDTGLIPTAAAGGDIEFARTLVGQSTSASILTLSNVGRSDLHVTSVSIDFGDEGDFRIAAGGPTPAPSFSPTVAPGASVTFGVTFAPAGVGAKTSFVRIESDDPDAPTMGVQLRGEAVACIASPTTGTMGTVVSVQGAGFGTKKGRMLVLGGKRPLALKVTRWNVGNDGVVTGVIRAPRPPGEYHVCVAPPRAAQIVDPAVFTFTAPVVVGVSPASGPARSEVVLTCTALGTTKGAVYLQAPGAKRRIRCAATAWPRDSTSGSGQGEARFRVPKKLVSGTEYDVIVVNKVGEGRAVGAFTAAP